jgi:hypothetical protein
MTSLFEKAWHQWEGRLPRSSKLDVDWQVPTCSSRQSLSRCTIDVIGRYEQDSEEAILEHLRTNPSSPLHGGYLFRSAGQNGDILFMGYSEQKWLRELAVWIAICGFATSSAQVLVVGSIDPHHTLPRIFAEFPRSRTTILGFQSPDKHILAQLNTHREPVILVGYASAIERLAEWQAEGIINLSIENIISCGDTMSAFTRAQCLHLWGIHPTNALNCTELGTLAISCSKGVYHALPDRNIIWEGSQAYCSEPEPDQFLDRHIRNFPLPFSCSPAGECGCGLKSTAFEIAGGRVVKFLTLTEGTTIQKIHPIAIRSALDTLVGIQAISISQTHPNEIRISYSGNLDSVTINHAVVRTLEKLAPHVTVCNLIVQHDN